MLTTETAAATGATLPALSMPELSISGLLDWANKSPLDTPDQRGGTARGKSHHASADATSTEGRAGRKPGKGKGELDPYKRYVDTPGTSTTGKARGTAKSFDARTSKRDAKKSTATSDLYLNADGSTTVRHFAGRANFKDDDGTWTPIDTRLVADKDGRLQERSNSLDVEFAPTAADQQLASVDFGSGRSLAYALRGATKAVPTVAANGTVSYAGVLPRTDLELVPLAEGFKENLVLRSAEAGNSWIFPLDLKGLTPRIADDGDVEFTDADGKVTATIPHAFMVDSTVDPRSGDPARSSAVSYALTTVDGKPALRMTADRKWLDDPERVYPVTVDPTITASNSTYTQNTIGGDHSTENLIKVGSYDSGTNKTNSFLQFSSLGTTLKGQRVSAATLNVYAIWSATCTPESFSVHPITQSWTPSGVTSYPGPTYGAAIGSATPSPGASCSNTDGGTDVGVKMPVALSTSWFDQVATGGANYGLALTAPTNDGLHWKKFHSDNSATAAWRPALDLTYTANTKPQVNAQYPPENFQAKTLQPELLVYASDADNWPEALTYSFEVYDAGSTSTTPVATSGLTAERSWKVPAGKLTWSKNYTWYVSVTDGYDSVLYSASRFSTTVPQPPVTSGLAQNTDGHEFDPSDGNYTTEDTDADVPVIGPSLEIDRSYNSIDPRIDSAFGAGWSTVVDMKAAESKDGTGSVTSVAITYPGGEQVAFGRNSDGTFVPPLGRYARLESVTGGYKLTDKDFTAYSFTQVTGKTGVYAISAITDYAGRAETFTYNASRQLTKITNTTSQRSLTLAWSTPAGATVPHVETVATDPSTAGDPNTAQTWQYGYGGDQLTKVCPPADWAKCTVYTYATGNHHRTTVLDADPYAYWRLGEAAGATVTKDTVDANQGKYNGLYRNVTLGGSGLLAGSTQKTATFNGTTSYVEMPSAPGATPSYTTISLWFKTTQVGGVLFYYGDKPLSVADPVGTTAYNTPALYVGTDGKLRGCLATGVCTTTMTSTASVNDGQWHQAVITGAGNTQTLYLDGASQGSKSGQIKDWNTPYISLGAGVNTHNWPAMNTADQLGHFSGQLAEAAIYTEPLTPDVIGAQYQAAKRSAGLLNKITTPVGKIQASVTYGTTDDLVLQATDGNGGTWKLNPATITGSSQVYRSAVMGSAPSGYWRLDDTQGAAQAANELHTGFGTYNTVTQGVAGPFGTGDATAAQFNGTSSYAEVPYGVWHNKPDRSVELWFKTAKPGVIMSDQTRAPNDPAGVGGSWSDLLYVGADNKLRGHWWSSTCNGNATLGSTASVTDNAWHHAALTSAGTTQTLYLDGVKQGTCTGAADDQTTSRTFIGAGFSKWYSSPGDVSYFTGSIAEVAVHSKGLTEDEIGQHWSAYKASSGVAPVRTVKLTDPSNKTLTYVYDAEMGNRLLAAIDTEGKRTTYGYDTAGFLHTVTDANGNRAVTGHDIRGNTVSTTTCQDTAANKCSTEYYSYYPDATTAFPPMDLRNDLLLTERDGRSSGPTDNTYLTTNTYDAGGNLTSVTTPPVPGHPNGRTASTTYTTATTPAAEGGTAVAPAGLVAQVVTAGGKKTSYTYFANGDLAEITDANGAKAKFTYDNLGREVSKTEISDANPGGMTTSKTYDKNDQVVTETSPAVTNRVTGAVHQARTTTGFDADGNILSQTVSDLTGGDAARTTTMTYTAYNQLATRTDPGGDTTSFEYDVYGNKVKETDPAGNVNTYTFDGENRPLTTNLLNYTGGDPSNPSAPTTLVQESRAYDPAGRLASITDAMGWVTAYTYTDDGLSATVVRKDPQSGKSFTEQANTYDAAGNLIQQVTNDGRTTSAFTVDAADRTTTSVLDPAGFARTTKVSYDPDDNVVSETETDPATGDTSTKDSRYDNLGNLTGTTVHDGTTAPVARYKLDETTGSSVADSSGANNTGTHGTGMHWNTDRGGSAVFDGDSASWAKTTGSVVSTSDDFTVSVWAKLADLTTNRTLLSQDGTSSYGFALYYSTANGWTFARPVKDVEPNTLVRAMSGTAAVTAGTWTHLTGVYDKTAGKIRLYVNGTLAQETAYTTPWEATGPLQLGRHKIGATGNGGNHKGGLDDVQVYSEALTASQVSAVYGGTLPAAGSSVRGTTWKLDQRGLPLAVTDANGNTTDYGYDEAGQQTSVTEPAVNAEQNGGTPVSVRPVSMTGYNTFGEPTESSDPRGNVSVTAYDAEGQESSTTAPNYTAPGSSTPITATSWNEYNRLGQVTAEVDPLGNRTTYTYTQLGSLASVTEPGGGTTTYAYSNNGEQLSAVRPNGARQETTWDFLGRPVTSTDIVRQPTQRAFTAINEYNAPGGELSRTVSPTGVTQSYAYNALGEVTEATDGAGNKSTFTYNMDGQVLTAKDPDGTSTKNTYDGFGQLTSSSDLSATGTVLRTTSADYDRAGNPVSVTDYRGHTRTLTYDATGLVTSAVEPVSATESITSTFGYDAAGNRTRFTDGRGNPFLTTYNAWGLPESVIEPSTPSHPDAADRTFTTVYDGAGRPKEMRSPGGVVITQEYDVKGRLIKQSGTGAEAATVDHTYDYDADDRVTAVAGAGEEKNTFSYDDRGQLLSTSGPSGASSFAYNGDGAMTSRTDASGTSSYGYDTAGRLKTVNDGATGTAMTYGYDVNNNVTSIDYGSGKSKRAFTYDALEQITSDKLTSPTGKVLSSTTYGWDENGNETSKTTTGVAGASTNTYTYDWANRLSSWNNGTATEVYGYDASGNRTRVGGDTYTYDARNRLTSDGHSSYAYTARGTMSSVTDEGGRTTAIKADAFNRVINEGERTYAYDGLDRLLNASDPQSGPLYSFQYSGVGNDVASDGVTSYSRNVDGSLLGVKTAVSAVLALTDIHTDVVAQFTAAGEALTGSATYSPFGKASASQGMIGQLGYQSGWTDPETAKVNMASRWYSPQTGQFNSRDTAANNPLPDSVNANRYAYANANPMTGVDPTGHWFESIKKAFKKVTNKVTTTVKSAWHATTATVQKAATVVKKAAVVVKRAVKRTVHRAYRAVRKTVRYVHDSVRKVKRYVKRTYKRVKRYVHKVVKHVKHTVRKVAKAVKHVAKKVVKAAKKVGTAVKKAAKATANFVKQNASTIASVAVGIAVFAGCTAITAGVGALGCAALAGAAANGVGYMMSDGPKTLGGFAMAVGVGALTGVVGGAAGGFAAGAAGRLLSGTAGRILSGAASGAAEGAATGAVEYGTSCINSKEGCSVGGAAKATAIGAAMGGVFGGAGSVRGPKGKTPPRQDAQPDAPTTCRVPTPHSFTGKTAVLLANGTTKPISKVKAGDYVLTAEPGKKKREKHRVKAVIVTKTDRDYVDVVVAAKAGPKTIQTTKHHQFYEATRNAWTQAGDLKRGQKLQNGAGGLTAIVEVKSYTAQRVTYDLSVDGLHTYFVMADGTPILVHNSGGSSSPRKGDAGTKRLVGELEANGYMIRGTEISAVSPNGVKIRFDVVAERDGALHLFDAKNGPRAMFTKGQGRRGGYAGIESGGGTWYGPNAEAAGLHGSFPASEVKIAGYGGYKFSGLCR